MKEQFGPGTVNVTRYILPLCEGGSLPALAEADDGFNYVLKFRGAEDLNKALEKLFQENCPLRFTLTPIYSLG